MPLHSSTVTFTGKTLAKIPEGFWQAPVKTGGTAPAQVTIHDRSNFCPFVKQLEAITVAPADGNPGLVYVVIWFETEPTTTEFEITVSIFQEDSTETPPFALA
jgi:hypothetical protein